MTPSAAQIQKAAAFRQLHDSGIFVMPCAWDAGSALVLQAAGFSALGTTSGGVNWQRGRRDYVYSVSRKAMLHEYAEIASAISSPVSGDLENGYGDSADDVADTVRLSIEHGLVGGSIEDQSSDGGTALLPLGLASDRIAAARECADGLLPDYTITARAESFYGDVDDPLSDAIERANRYVAAGADCIFVPGVTNLNDVKRLVASVPAPISLGIGSGGADMNLAALEEAGVRRVSTGGALPRALYAQIRRASTEMLAEGTFGFVADAMSGDDLESHFD